MGGRLTRFLNLERRRPATGEPQHEVLNKARFEGATPEIGVSFDFGEQPFLRCPSCEADNNKQAERCLNCERSLLGEEVKAWNAAFWERRKSEQPLPPPSLPGPPQLSDESRKLGEALAMEVAQRERARLWWWNSSGAQDATPAGVRLLGLIGNPNTRFIVAAAAVVTFIGSGLLAFTLKQHPGLQAASAVIAMSLFLLFMPNIRRYRRWWDYWD